MLLTCIFAACVIVILGHPRFIQRIPNGNKVPNPCGIQYGIWIRVGHNFNNIIFNTNKSRNPFGLDFVNSTIGNKAWSVALCEKDSDGDGVTNGAELGDPDCEWSKGDTPAGDATGHPGYACDHDDGANTCASIIDCDN